MPALALSHLFRATMVKSYEWYGIDNFFTVELKHNAQYAVGAGMLWAHVQEHQVGIFADTLHPKIFRVKLQRLLLHLFLF